MTKTEMASKLASKTDMTVTKAMEVLNTIFDADPNTGIIATELDAGRKVTIPGFGTFATRHRAARTGRNPSTGAAIEIPARTYAYFRPGKTLRESVEK